MRSIWSRSLAILLVTIAMLNSHARAEEQPELDPQVRALIERLEAAEKQIQTLNAELQKVKVNQSNPRPFPGGNSPQGLPGNDSALPLAVDEIFQEPPGRIQPQQPQVDSSIAKDLPSVSIRAEELAVFQDEGSDSDRIEERLGVLEEGWKELDAAWDKFNAAEKKKKADAAKKPTFNIGGRVHADYWDFVNNSTGIGYFEHPDMMEDNYGTPPEDRALFRRIRLEMKGDILETMLWRVQVDFNNPSTPEIKDVYLGFKELPFNQQLLIGTQKRPLGLDHLNSSRFNVFLERPFVVEAFNEDARRPGVAMYGFTEDESLHWRYGAYLLENVSTDGRYIGQSGQWSFNGRLSGSPWYDETSGGRGYFHWAVSGMYGRPDGDADGSDTNSNEARFRTRPSARTDERWLNTGRIAGAEDFEIIGIESIFNVGPFQAVGEYQSNWVQRDAGETVHLHGGYFYLSYFLTGEHIPYERKSGTIGRVKPFENFFLVDNCCGGVSTGWGAWNVALRYDYLDLTSHDIQGGVGEAWTTALNWWWTPYSRVMFNASYGDITQHEPINGFDSGNYFFIGTRFAVDF